MGWGWGGVGWDDNVPCTCTHGRCYATSCFLHLHEWLALRNIMFLALAHMVGATQHHVSCTCTHGRCYATSWGGVGMITFLALTHMVGATQHHVCRCLCMHKTCMYMYNQWLPSSKVQTLMMTKSQTQQRTTPKGLTVRHCNLFSCSNSLRLPVHCDTSSKNTVAHSTFERLDHHDISKIVILPHKLHVSHKYKCMNDGFFVNQRADQKNFVRAEHHSM